MSNLQPLQRDFLAAWFRQTQDFFLTGGAALIEFFSVTRQTDDVDLFTVKSEAFEMTAPLVMEVCRHLGATAEALRTYPTFRRYRVTRDAESTIVDLVHDQAPQLHAEKQRHADGIVTDSVDEILVNKICALVGRSEPRDFLDIWHLSTQGLDVNHALQLASIKDGGVDAESLLFVLQGLTWDSFSIPGTSSDTIAAIKQFFKDWSQTLALRLFPGTHS